MSIPLGLYFGAENIDVVSLTGTFQRPKILAFARTQLPAESHWRNLLRVEGLETAGPIPPGVAEGLPSIARVLQTLLAKLGIPSPQAHVALPSEAVVIRYFQMPLIPAHERKMAISFEARKYLPFKIEELIFDYEVVIRRNDPAVMRVMFFGVKRNSIKTYLSLFHSAGITPLCLEPTPLSLMRLVRHSRQLSGDQVAAFLYVEHDSATISIARNDILYLSRNISIPSAGGVEEEPPPDLLEALVSETRVSIDYYRRRFLGEPAVNKILFFGKSVDPKRAAELSAALDLPAETADPFAKMSGAQTIPSGLAVVAGLALRGLERRPKDINLLPAESRSSPLGMWKLLVWESAAAVLALAAWHGFSVANLTGMEKRLSDLGNQTLWPKGVPRTTELPELRQLKNTVEQELQVLTKLQDSSLQPSQIIATLSKQMPLEIWLQYFLFRNTYQPGEPGRRRFLRLVGNACAADRSAELERVNQFLTALRQDPLFSSAFREFSLDSVQRAQLQEEEITEFQITCATDAGDLRRDLNLSQRYRGP